MQQRKRCVCTATAWNLIVAQCSAIPTTGRGNKSATWPFPSTDTATHRQGPDAPELTGAPHDPDHDELEWPGPGYEYMRWGFAGSNGDGLETAVSFKVTHAAYFLSVYGVTDANYTLKVETGPWDPTQCGGDGRQRACAATHDPDVHGGAASPLDEAESFAFRTLEVEQLENEGEVDVSLKEGRVLRVWWNVTDLEKYTYELFWVQWPARQSFAEHPIVQRKRRVAQLRPGCLLSLSAPRSHDRRCRPPRT